MVKVNLWFGCGTRIVITISLLLCFSAVTILPG